jgi:hypothetical protein
VVIILFHLPQQPVTQYLVFMGLASFSLLTAIIPLNSIKELIVVMVNCGVLFEARAKFLNSI